MPNPFSRLWARLSGFFAGLFRRKPPEPGRFVEGRKFAWRGFVAAAPWILPQRDYLVYVPAAHDGFGRWRRRPLLVLLHGCRQSPEDIATGSRIATMADAEGLMLLLPRQNPHANTWGCWNWFDGATAHGWGEAAIVAAQIRDARRSYRIDKRRVFVAGMSSGGGLAAILGLRHADLVAGVFVHSGVACGAASVPHAALSVLAHGADTDVVGIGRNARGQSEAKDLPVPLCVVQGAVDDVVAPINAAQLVRQYLALNGHPSASAEASAATDDPLPTADRVEASTTTGGRPVTLSEWRVGERIVVRHIAIGGLGHAWSGGDDTLPYNDPQPPDATALLRRFIADKMTAG